MKPAWLKKLSPAWRARMVRLGFNFHPAFRGTGGRVVHVARDLRHIRVALPLSWKTRNIVGSLYGGSLFAITDGAHPMMLMAALGDDYIVWDKAASIDFIAPGKGPVYADFRIDEALLDEIRQHTAGGDKYLPQLHVDVHDGDGTLVARVHKTLYVRLKPRVRQAV